MYGRDNIQRFIGRGDAVAGRVLYGFMRLAYNHKLNDSLYTILFTNRALTIRNV